MGLGGTPKMQCSIVLHSTAQASLKNSSQLSNPAVKGSFGCSAIMTLTAGRFLTGYAAHTFHDTLCGLHTFPYRLCGSHTFP